MVSAIFTTYVHANIRAQCQESINIKSDTSTFGPGEGSERRCCRLKATTRQTFSGNTFQMCSNNAASAQWHSLYSASIYVDALMAPGSRKPILPPRSILQPSHTEFSFPPPRLNLSGQTAAFSAFVRQTRQIHTNTSPLWPIKLLTKIQPEIWDWTQRQQRDNSRFVTRQRARYTLLPKDLWFVQERPNKSPA